MRPTIHQVYCNPHAIIAALEAAGMEYAQARVMAMMTPLCEYYSMKAYHDRVEKDRTYSHQSEERRLRWPGATPDPQSVRRNRQSIAEYNKTLILARGYLNRTERQLNLKIAKWPDINLDPSKLETRPDGNLVSKILKRRMRRGKRKVRVLG